MHTVKGHPIVQLVSDTGSTLLLVMKSDFEKLGVIWDTLGSSRAGPTLHLQRLTLLSPHHLSSLTRMGPAGGHLSVSAMTFEERSRNKWAGEIPSPVL